jgi:hypothetical protein
MAGILPGIRRWLLGVSADAALRPILARESTAPAAPHLERIVRTFLRGYDAALRDPDPERVAPALNAVEPALRGFAFEGAAFGLGLLDALRLGGRDRFRRFVAGPARDHVYLAHVGLGWAVARLPWAERRLLAGADPALRWLVFDGLGFHAAFFDAARTVDRQRAPRRLAPHRLRAFDQGVGRALWFLGGARPERVAALADGFAAERQADLWRGIGLASAYAGGRDGAALPALRERACAHVAELAQGVAFAAKARSRAGNPAPHTDESCTLVWGLPAEEVARWVDASFAAVAPERETDYAAWQSDVQARFRASRGAALHA